MKITQASGEVVQVTSVAGLFECKLTHEVKSTKARFDWKGPVISREEWAKILAFFYWTYDTTKSESQVRLFVHPTLGWKAWAFPQEAGTGMTTREIDTPETKARYDAGRALFNDEWTLYGTVHHHCSASAFQSGTDESNEKSQEGLHITVGNIDKKTHSIHARFYYKGCKFEPSLNEFWDVGIETRSKAEEFLGMFGVGVDFGKVAERQMAAVVDPDTPFPAEWRENFIEKKWTPAVTTYPGNGTPYHSNYGGVEDVGLQGFPSRAAKGLWRHFKQLYREEIKAAKSVTPEIKDLIDGEVEGFLDDITRNKDLLKLLDLCDKHSCELPDAINKLGDLLNKKIELEPDDTREEQTIIGGTGNGNGSPVETQKGIHAMNDKELEDYWLGRY